VGILEEIMSAPKCSKCAHSRRHLLLGQAFAKCAASDFAYDGEHFHCATERMFPVGCGPSGKYFEPKPRPWWAIGKSAALDWLASWLFLAVSLLCAIAMFWSAIRIEFVEVAAYFYCSLAWFDMHIKNMECVAMLKRMEKK
jgi:hypothetical protein